jgi:hypothetical protein
VTNVKNVNPLFPLEHAEDHAIDMRLAAIEQMPGALVLRSNGASVWMPFQAEDHPPKTLVPAERRGRLLGMDVLEERNQVSLSAGREANEIGHTWPQIP